MRYTLHIDGREAVPFGSFDLAMLALDAVKDKGGHARLFDGERLIAYCGASDVSTARVLAAAGRICAEGSVNRG